VIKLKVLEFLFPNFTCLVCRSELNSSQNPYICDRCVKNLPFNAEPVVLKDDKQHQYFYKAFAPFKYKEPITDLVLRLKYGAERFVAVGLAPFMAAVYMLFQTISRGVGNSLLVPVPLSEKRRNFRGYNQAELLALELAKILGLAYSSDILFRVKSTEVQNKMTVAQREANLKNAFIAVNKEEIRDRKIILVDDVFTSGATANECAKALMKAGAWEVTVLTIAAVL
jgi:ComF family protein